VERRSELLRAVSGKAECNPGRNLITCYSETSEHEQQTNLEIESVTRLSMVGLPDTCTSQDSALDEKLPCVLLCRVVEPPAESVSAAVSAVAPLGVRLLPDWSRTRWHYEPGTEPMLPPIWILAPLSKLQFSHSHENLIDIYNAN